MGVRGLDAQSISSVVFRLRYPLYISFVHFDDEIVLKEGGFVTPRPKRVYGMCNRMCTKGFLNYFSAIIEFLKVF